ncbi:MAG: phosphatase PAP2 family protein [Acidimicrobiales bacterium]
MKAVVPALAAGTGVAVATTVLARRRVVHPAEREVFHAVNDLPRGLAAPITVVMQAGSFPAVFVTAGVERLAGHRRLAVASALAGTAVWAGCKVIKRSVGRGRPTDHLEHPTIRGAAQRGLGFPSGHAAVVVTLAGLVAPVLPRPARIGVWAVAATTAVARVYVGAHLPLDVVGGAGVGLAAASAARLALGRHD